MAVQTALFHRQQPGGIGTIVDVPDHPGSVWFVDSTHAAKADSAGSGQGPDTPFATLDYAIGLCTANKGDTIYLQPGHAETKSVTGSLFALDVAGVRVVAAGRGPDRATFTFSHTGAATTISAAGVTLENVVFVAGTDSVTAPLTISAADVTLRNMEIRDAANVEFVTGITTTNAADRLHIDGLRYRGDVATGDACLVGVNLAGCDDVLIENCIFDGVASTGFIYFSVAVDNVHVRNCIFNNVGTALSLDVVDVGASTWDAISCWDLVGGYAFSGGSGAALATEDVSGLAATITVIDEYHDVPAANNVLNAQINEVIGNKSDTVAAGDVTATDTLVAYIKQIVSELSGATGIATWPAGAAAASGVSIAEALRYIGENMVPAIAIHTKADVTSAVAWTTGNSPVSLFTVTGDVMARCFATVQTLVETTATNGTLEVGVAGNTAILLPQEVADGTALAAGDAWSKTTAADANGAVLDGDWVLIAGGADITLTVATNSTTAGAATVYCQYIPVSVGATVVTT